MRQPQNASVLERSRFLNAVFARKSFSWTAVMMDLERVLPPGVQVTSIEPQILADGAVNIRLRVSGDRDRAVALVRNLETSSRFVAPRLAGEAAQASESGSGLAGGARTAGMSSTGTTPITPGGVEFEIYSGYNPLPAAVRTAKAPQEDSGVSLPGTRGILSGGVGKTRRLPDGSTETTQLLPSGNTERVVRRPNGGYERTLVTPSGQSVTYMGGAPSPQSAGRTPAPDDRSRRSR